MQHRNSSAIRSRDAERGVVEVDLHGLPRRDRGLRSPGALPYILYTHANTEPLSTDLELTFESAGSAGALFHVHDRLQLDRFARRYTLEAGKRLVDTWSCRDSGGQYDLQVVAHDGFLRHFRGRLAAAERCSRPCVELRYEPWEGSLELLVWNLGERHTRLHVASNLDAEEAPFELPLASGGHARRCWSVRGGRYDLTLTVEDLPGWSQRYAGRMQKDRDATSDPESGADGRRSPRSRASRG